MPAAQPLGHARLEVGGGVGGRGNGGRWEGSGAEGSMCDARKMLISPGPECLMSPRSDLLPLNILLML